MNIFDYLEQKSIKWADKIGRGETQEKIEVYRYVVFGIVAHLFSEIIGITISMIFGYWAVYLICDTSFILLRFGAGGYHCNNFKSCVFTSNIIQICGCILAYLLQDYALYFWLASLFCGVYMLPICPKPSENSESRGYSEDIRFRKKYRNALLFICIVSLVLLHFNLNLYSAAISSGIMTMFFTLSNFGENIMNKFNAKEGNNGTH